MASQQQRNQDLFSAFAAELMKLQESIRPARKRYNPRPAGWIQPGGSTETVLKHLQSVDRHQTRKQIMEATGLTEKACNWALLYLRSVDMVSVVADECRNGRYFRYKWKVKDVA